MRHIRVFGPVLFCLLTAAWAQPGAASADQAVVKTDMGTFRIELAADKAPHHVAEFIARAKTGYYDGSVFHRVVPNGLIQGGDPQLKDPNTPRERWGKGGRDIKMNAELSDLKHVRGVVSTVRTYDQNTDGPQFFVCLSDMPALDSQFTTFGKVVEGLDVVDKISKVPADEHNLAKTPVKIISVTIEKAKAH